MSIYKYLIKVLRDYFNREPTEVFNTDWSKMFLLSKNHEVAAIVYVQCKSFIPIESVGEFERAYSSTLFYYANRLNIVNRIEAELSDLEHFIIKGATIAAFYPNPALRTMGDVDFVVHTEDRCDIDGRLKSIGLKCISSYDNHEWQYSKCDIEFEIHNYLVYPESFIDERQMSYFNDFWKYVHNNRLDWNFHFVFLLFHLRKHFMYCGVGIRQFIDIAVLCSRGLEFDWAWIEAELKKLGLWLFAERVFALNEYWFDVTPPVEIDAMPEEFYPSATELVLKNGVFGFDNEENRDNAAVNNVRAEGNSKGSMLKLAMHKLFPSYKVLITVPHYAYLRNRPYLLPVVWVHRMFRSIANRRVLKNMKNVVETSFVDQETIKRREEVYREWGL